MNRHFDHLILAALSVLAGSTTELRAEPTSSEIADITWKIGPNCPEFRKGGCLTISRGQLISAFGMRQPWGEMNTSYGYDPKRDEWFKGPDTPIGQAYVQGTECGRFFYSIGGRSADHGGAHRLCFQLDLKTDPWVWNKAPALKDRRAWAASTSIRTKLYVFGGALGGRGPTLSGVEMWDSADANSEWHKVTDIPGDSRGWATAAGVDGRLFLIGGLHFFNKASNPDRKRFKEVLEWIPDQATWKQRAPLPFRLSGMDSCVYGDRYIIVVGGCPNWNDYTPEMRRERSRDRFHKSYYNPFVYIYDVVNDTWRRMPSPLPAPTNDIRVAIHGETLYALGGENMEPATSNTTPWLRIGTIHLAD